MRAKKAQRRYAGAMALVLLGMVFLPYLYLPGKAYGAVSFGGGEISYSEELVALWDDLAAQEDMERTDFIGHMTRTYPVPGIVIYKQQTSVSPGGRWADYEYRYMYCISHSRELAENPNTTMETTAVWYIKKEPYTLNNLPGSIVGSTADEYQRRLNFLLMAYGANHEAYQGTVNSDPVVNTANYYLCQSFCTLSEEARFTGDRAHDWGMYRQHATQIANRYNPSGLGSTRVYSEMMRDMESTFNAVWNTAKVAADCVESSDSGYVFHPAIALEEDGMYHARYLLTPDTKKFFGSAAIIPHGDWSCEVKENEIDFKSQSGQLSEDGYVAEIDLGNANGIIRKTIGNESVRELHMPVKLGNRWSLTFAQGNLIANLTEGFRIVVGNPRSDNPASSTTPYPAAPTVTRYKHTEKWQADYVVNLRKLDSETGKPLEGAWFDILEAFDDSQLEGSILEDDNWDNDRGSQFLRWDGWDSPYGDSKDKDPCEKDQEVTDRDGWLVEAASFGAGELQPSGVRAHRDTKYYSYTKGYCGGHPKPESGEDEEEDDEAMEEYERQIEICESLAAAGGFYHSLEEGAKELLKEDRDRHYEEFVSLTYDYSARELAARNGYILHNQDQIHEPFENIFDGIHHDTVPVETVTVYSSQYYALEGGEEEEKEEESWQDERISEEDGFWRQRAGRIGGAKAAGWEPSEGKKENGKTGGGEMAEAEEQAAAREMAEGKPAEEKLAAAWSNAASIEEKLAATWSNAASIKTEVFPGEEVDLEDVWILDEDGTYEEDPEDDLEDEQGLEVYKASPSNGEAFIASASDASPSNAGFPGMIRLLPGMIRKAGYGTEDENAGRKQGWQGGKKLQGRRRQNEEEASDSARGSVTMEESQVAPLSPADPDYSGNGGADWSFEVHDHRTEAEVHINKRDLLLRQGEDEEYDSYGDTQGDGTLEGAVYGLFAAEDLVHPDGKTGIVFEKGNLVAVAATDKNGDASFMVITEAPGTIYDYDLGKTVNTGFTGPKNDYIQKLCRHTSNPDKRNGEQWYYPVQDNQSDNGNCWIGRPLLLGSYYVQELTRSEGYELSVYGADARISNRSSFLAGGGTEAKGRVQVKKAEGNIRVMEDTQKEEMVTEITLSGSGADYGYDIFLKNIPLEAKPSFWLTFLGKKEAYQEWKEPEIYYETVEAATGTLVMINGKSVKAVKGEIKELPNGEYVTIRHTKEAAISPEELVLTGPKGAIRTLDIQYIPELTGILGGDEEGFISSCNQAMVAAGLKDPGENSPYFLVELGEDTVWAQKLYDFFAREDGPAFNGARLEKIVRQNGKTYGVLRYSFSDGNEDLPVVFSASDQTFYVKYPADFSNDMKGYVYRGYPLDKLPVEDYEMGVYLYRWIRVPNVKPERPVALYEDLSQIPYVSAQEFCSYWVYGEGESLRAEDGSIYQKECTRYIEKSGYQTVETTSYEEMEAAYDPITRTWKLHAAPEKISQDGEVVITIRYGDRFGGGGGSVSAAAAPSMNLTGTYVKPVVLTYPGQYSVYEDAGTRLAPVEVSERAIIQKLQVKKDIDQTSYNNTNSYGTVHEDWFTRLFGGYGQEGDPEALAGKMDRFRFKVYLRSNLTRLYRWEDGQVVWQDRSGTEMDQREVLKENRCFPGKVRKIYTKVLHRTDPLYQDSRDSIAANERLYEYTDGWIHEEPEKGYTAVLETIERPMEDKEGIRMVKGYNYDKFFDAINTANHDKWDDRAPSYTSWQPIGNVGNRREETIENARVSDQVRQFAIDWYLQDEVKKLTAPVGENQAENQAAEGQEDYPDEIYDRALWEAIKKAENYLKPFFAYDLDEIYAVLWDGEEDGGSDKDASTLSADSLGKKEDGYYGVSAYLPYGTYVVAEQQPKYSGLEYGKNLKDFKNKHYQTDKPKEVALPAVYSIQEGEEGIFERLNGYYCYDASMPQPELERKYRIRFNQEDHVIQAHNHHGDFEIYKYGMDISRIANGIPQIPGKQDYFALTQDIYKPYKNYYNPADNRTEGEVEYYLSEGKSGQKGVAPHYRYSSVSEHGKTADNVLCFGGISTEDNLPGMWYQDQVAAMHGVQTAYDGLYAPVLVPWSIAASELPEDEIADGEDIETGESDYMGLGTVRFRNRFFTAKLRLEKLDSETHENILHDSAIFAIYAAERDDSEDGDGRVVFYEKDTMIAGTRKFLESMGADFLSPVARRMSVLDRILGKDPGPGELYTGIVPAGTPVCKESEKIITGKGQGNQAVAFASYSTVLDGKMKAEEGEGSQLLRQLQTVGYLETPRPLGAGVYVICEEKAPMGYVRSKPMAVEVYSDKVTYYKEGRKDSRVVAAMYETLPEDSAKNQNKPQDTGNLARIHVENIPIKLTVEKLKESSKATANTTQDKTVTYKVSGRIDGSLVEIGNHPDYVYAYKNGRYLGYGWKKGTLEYLASRKAAGERVELAYEGEIFAGYGYVTRVLDTADDENPYVAGAWMALFDAMILDRSGDTQDHAYEGLVIERNASNNIARMYVKEGYAGEKTEFVKEKDEDGGLWTAGNVKRPDTDILYYDLDSLEVVAVKNVDGKKALFGYDRDHKLVPVSQVESDKENFDQTDTEHSLFAFKGGIPYLELVGGDFSKLQYSAMDKVLKVGQGTLVYHLDRNGSRDSLVDPYTGMAYVEMPGGDLDKVLVWPVKVHRDRYNNVIARDKITTCRTAVIGENEDGYEEKAVLEVINHSGQEIPMKQHPSFEHRESGSVSGTWNSKGSGESHRELTVYTNRLKQNLNGEVLADENNGSFLRELNPVLSSYGLPVYYQKSQETYDKGTELYDRNGDFVRYQDSDNLRGYNNNAYHINPRRQLCDGDETKEKQDQKKLFHRQGEGYILENAWITSDKTPNDPFHSSETAGQADILKRVPAGAYIMEELKSPSGYLKGMPTGVVVQEDTKMQHASMVDKTTKVEISKLDGADSRELRILQKRLDGTKTDVGRMTERSGSYTFHLVPGAELALFEARKIYSPEEPGGYYLEKISDEPLVYESTDSRAGAVKRLTARWITGNTPIYAEGIPEGSYILEELVTPPGFTAGKPLKVEIKNTPQVQVIIMGNDHTKVEIEKYEIKEDEKVQLAGAQFALYEAALDGDGEVIFHEGIPEYDSKRKTDSWVTVPLEEYTGFIPAFEAMYRDYGAREGNLVRWNAGEKAHEAKCVSSYSPDSPEGSTDRLHPADAELILEMEDGRKIRVTVWGGDSFEYQFDYRRLSQVNEYACSYVTLNGVRRFDYLPAGKAYVLAEEKAPEGFSKAKDRLILVTDTGDVQRYAVENTDGRLYVSKGAKDRRGELAGACLQLYRAERDGSFIMDEQHLVAKWITGSDGVYTDLDYVNDRILPGYQAGDLKPHEISRLEDGIYWLAEEKSPDYYTTFRPMQIEYHKEDEIRVVRAENVLVEGSLELGKTDEDGKSLEGAVFELAAYRQRDMLNPVFTKRISDHEGCIQVTGLPVGEAEEDGKVAPYLYKLKEIIPPDGYEVNTRIFTWSFEPNKNGQSYAVHEEAKKKLQIADKRTRVYIGKKDFDQLGEGEAGFLAGAEFAVYEITGRSPEGSLLYDEALPFDTWITGREEAHELLGLIAGRSYLLKELKAPRGYHLMDPVLFAMSMDGRKIIKISSQVNTVTIHSAENSEDERKEGDPNGDSICGVTIKGRYPIRVEYEMKDSSGNQAAHWTGTKDGHTLYKKDGLKEGEIYTITEYTRYSDGSRPITGRRTEALFFNEKNACHIPGREALRTALTLSRKDGTRIASFFVNEVIQEKTIKNNRLPENPQMMLKNRDGYMGTALDPAQPVMGTIAFINDSESRADMEIVVNLDSSVEILDFGGGTLHGNQIRYLEKDVSPLERRTVSYVAAVQKGGESVHGTAEIRYQGRLAATSKTVPLLQKKKLVIYNELTGSGKEVFGEEEDIFEIRLYQENGEELKGRYEYGGSRSGTIQSGGSIALAGNEFVAVDPGFYENVRYAVTRKEGHKQEKEEKLSGIIGKTGACAAFTRHVWDNSQREVFRKGESYLLTEQTMYSDQALWESGRFVFDLDEQAKISSITAADKKTEVALSKSDITGMEELSGCHMSLKDHQGKELDSWISGKEPHRIQGVLTPGEVYYLEEIRPSDGYAFAEKIPFLVSEDGVLQQVAMKDEDTKIRIHKVPGQRDEKELSGAVLQILEEDKTPARAACSKGGFQKGELLIFRSGEAPKELLGQLCAGRRYLLHEVKPPAGYAFAEDIPFTVSLDGSIDEVWMEDEQTHVVFCKTDITGEKEIPGNHLRVTTTEGTEILSWVSGTEPYELVGVLDAGEAYILEEIQPVDGYAWSEKIPFKVSLDGRIDRVLMKNDRTQAEILKVDADTGEPVPEALLQIRDQEGQVIEEWVSGTGSHLVTGKLAAGKTYELWEKEAPEGYWLAGKMEFTMPEKAEAIRLVYENRKKPDTRTPDKPEKPDKPQNPEKPREPGRITAFYESQTPKEVKEFFDDQIPKSFRLSKTGDDGVFKWYLACLVLSFFGMCTAFFAIFMTKPARSDIIDRVKRKNAEKDKTK